MLNNSTENQLDYFEETAREFGVDERNNAVDKIMGKLNLSKKPDAD